MFCHHHDESEVYGAEPVPCPLCGLGGEGSTPGPRPEPEAEDANDALRHALFDEPSSGSGSELSVIW